MPTLSPRSLIQKAWLKFPVGLNASVPRSRNSPFFHWNACETKQSGLLGNGLMQGESGTAVSIPPTTVPCSLSKRGGQAGEIQIVLGAAERPQINEFVPRVFFRWWWSCLRYQRQRQRADDQRQLQVIEMMFCIHNF